MEPSQLPAESAPAPAFVLVWHKLTTGWSRGTLQLYAGKWPVGSVSRAIVKQGDPASYSAGSRLPGLKELLGSYPSEDEAKAHVERATRHWFQQLAAVPKRTD